VSEAIPIIVKSILSKRGMAEADMARFLAPDYALDLHDPFLMTDMKAAVDRVLRAAEAAEKVVIYGDYDIDGLTATVVMNDTLRGLGLDPEMYIPDRFDEGYGLNADAIRQMAGRGVSLIVSVDCGVTAAAEAELARELGVDLIITDHHSVPEVIPKAVAVVNPKRVGDLYPFKDLCGAGVAFKVAQAIQRQSGKPALGREKWLLDLVALGTVGDVVSLVDENRALVKYGLMVMTKTRRPGLRALAEAAGVDIGKITSTQIGFNLGPRLNAAGRMGQADLALELLSTADSARAQRIAAELEELNLKRRADQKEILGQADAMAAELSDDPVLVLVDPAWSHGIVGIVASALAEKWDKPVFVGQVMGDEVKGSARSRDNYDMAAAFRANADLLERFGGHFHAAGATFALENLEAFRDGLIAYYFENETEAVENNVTADVVAEDLSALNWNVFEQVEMMEPFGVGNPKPVFELKNTKVIQYRTMGKEREHLKIRVQDNNSRTIEGIAFGQGDIAERIDGKIVTILGELNKNEFRGNVTLEIGIGKISFE
jgi:single-stranded-DNA-specific exonuclease